MIDPTTSVPGLQNLIADLQARVRRLESSWVQTPQALPYDTGDNFHQFSSTSYGSILEGNCIVTAQYFHYLMAVDSGSYTGGGSVDVQMQFVSTAVGGTQTSSLTSLGAAGPGVEVFQGSVDLFDLIGADVRGKECIYTLQGRTTISGGFASVNALGGFTLRANPSSLYKQILG